MTLGSKIWKTQMNKFSWILDTYTIPDMFEKKNCASLKIIYSQ